ncbi:hypothetical protein ACIF8T_14185, partial [Streptomyces sp. NPDC085946]
MTQNTVQEEAALAGVRRGPAPDADPFDVGGDEDPAEAGDRTRRDGEGGGEADARTLDGDGEDPAGSGDRHDADTEDRAGASPRPDGEGGREADARALGGDGEDPAEASARHDGKGERE